MLNRAKPKSHVCGFRLTAEEHELLAAAAHIERRKMADLVHLIVAEALEEYAQRFAITIQPASPEAEPQVTEFPPSLSEA